jgi:hypothetical protein
VYLTREETMMLTNSQSDNARPGGHSRADLITIVLAVTYFFFRLLYYYGATKSMSVVLLYLVFALFSLVALLLLLPMQNALMDRPLRQKIPVLVIGLLYIVGIAAFDRLLSTIVR